jgi:hypothetical protein
MDGKTIYKNPPIIERIVGVYTDIKPEVFEAKMPDWAAKIRDQYPLARPIAEWSIKVKEVKGVPMLENVMPKAEIIQLFWKPHPKKLQVHGMRLRPSRLVFHLCREDGNAHDFEELYAEMETWIGRWMEHFEVEALKGVTAEYFNRLNPKITPQFMLPDGRLKLSEAFLLFANIPGKYQSITPPYDNRIRLIVDEKRPCYFDLRVRADDDGHVGVRIDFMVTTIGDRAISAKDALAEIRLGHDVILEQFDCLFSEKARQSFTHYGISDAQPPGQHA